MAMNGSRPFAAWVTSTRNPVSRRRKRSRRVRSLFLKIFLWYWATVLLVGLAVASVWALQPEMIVSRWRAATSEAITIYAQSAAEEFDRFGLAPLNNYFQRLRTTSRIRAALLDENGALIAGDV